MDRRFRHRRPPAAAAAVATFNPEDVAGAVACWVADDLSAVGDGNAVSSWVDRIGSFDAAQATGTKQPLYLASGIGGQPAVDFDGTDDLLVYTAVNPVSTATSGHVFTVLLRDTSTDGDTPWSSMRTSSNQFYLMAVGAAAPACRIQQRNGDTEETRTSTGGLPISTDLLYEIASDGSAYMMRSNGVSQTLSSTASGDWFGDITTRNYFTFAAQKFLTSSEFGQFDGKIALMLVVDGAISADDRTALNAWVTAKYGITLA